MRTPSLSKFRVLGEQYWNSFKKTHEVTDDDIDELWEVVEETYTKMAYEWSHWVGITAMTDKEAYILITMLGEKIKTDDSLMSFELWYLFYDLCALKLSAILYHLYYDTITKINKDAARYALRESGCRNSVLDAHIRALFNSGKN